MLLICIKLLWTFMLLQHFGVQLFNIFCLILDLCLWFLSRSKARLCIRVLISFLCKHRLLAGNPLLCVCENMWIKELLDDSERDQLQCLEDGGRVKSLSQLTVPSCGNSICTVESLTVVFAFHSSGMTCSGIFRHTDWSCSSVHSVNSLSAVLSFIWGKNSDFYS